MSDQSLREALERIARGDVPLDTPASHFARDALAALPAAPAVPQPVDREALADDVDSLLWRHRTVASNGTQTVCACDRAWRSDTEHRTHLRNAVLAVLAGEQEQVEP